MVPDTHKKIKIKNKVITTSDFSDHVDINNATNFNHYVHMPTHSNQRQNPSPPTLNQRKFIIRLKNTTNHLNPKIHLDHFSPIDLFSLTKLVSSSKASTCLLDPIPTWLLKEVFLSNQHITCTKVHFPQSFKVALIKPLLKKNIPLIQRPWPTIDR